jgi:hypothetical protein
MYRSGRAGVAPVGAVPAFARPSEPAIGNDNPAWTGSPGNAPPAVPGPHPFTQPLGGQVGRFDGASGADSSAPELQPHPHVTRMGAEQENCWRYGLQGFNDRLQVRDRHAYWDRGSQNTGLTGPAWGLPNTYNPDQFRDRARPDLRAVNISVNPQIGSDASRNQDDLSRPYTWLGQWDGTSQPVYGGVPGLWAEYGNRGFSDRIHDPSNGQGGPALVYSGPPHGLHSDTMPSGKQIADRYSSTPQMRPVRLDRPDNSTSAGQSYSQTVLMQGQTSGATVTRSRGGAGLKISGRGWAGQ